MCVASVLLVVGCSADPEDVVREPHWETFLTIGSTRLEDTTMLDPADILLLNDLLIVLDDREQRLTGFSLANGGLLGWRVGARGQGPGEMEQALMLLRGPRDEIWTPDARNRKMLRFNTVGAFLGETYYRHLPGGVSRPFVTGDRVLWPQLLPAAPLVVTSPDGLQILGQINVDWPIPHDLAATPDLRAVGFGSAEAWVLGLQLGPFFAVGQQDSVHIFPYASEIPYAFRQRDLRSMPKRADSARWAARDAAIAGGEIFFLFGGRPRRHAHPEEPTRTIAVYGLDGAYLRSYRLPFHATSMVTADGRDFYFLTQTESGLPRVVGLRLVTLEGG